VGLSYGGHAPPFHVNSGSSRTHHPYPHPLASAGNTDLGTACGKYFRVGVLSITDAGDSDIISSNE
jgi:hypothetical protein